ncbi:MAG: hypothetical protein NT049_12395, partial [Planctomycetota bacterium]|nr:hypothetical protein [Planctomycetota bacterium]
MVSAIRQSVCLAALAACLLALFCAGAPAAENAPPVGKASIKVQADQPGVKIPPTLYGLFFEEINHAGDGGLYAELICNRSFEDGEKLNPWMLVTGGTRTGEITLDKEKPMSEKNPQSLRL